MQVLYCFINDCLRQCSGSIRFFIRIRILGDSCPDFTGPDPDHLSSNSLQTLILNTRKYAQVSVIIRKSLVRYYPCEFFPV
jgi:hypothetical protein